MSDVVRADAVDLLPAGADATKDALRVLRRDWTFRIPLAETLVLAAIVGEAMEAHGFGIGSQSLLLLLCLGGVGIFVRLLGDDFNRWINLMTTLMDDVNSSDEEVRRRIDEEGRSILARAPRLGPLLTLGGTVVAAIVLQAAERPFRGVLAIAVVAVGTNLLFNVNLALRLHSFIDLLHLSRLETRWRHGRDADSPLGARLLLWLRPWWSPDIPLIVVVFVHVHLQSSVARPELWSIATAVPLALCVWLNKTETVRGQIDLVWLSLRRVQWWGPKDAALGSPYKAGPEAVLISWLLAPAMRRYREATEELAREERRLASRLVLANLQHKVDQPVSAIAGVSRELARESLSPDVRELVKVLGLATDALVQWTRGELGLLQPDEPARPTDLCRIVQDATALCQRAALTAGVQVILALPKVPLVHDTAYAGQLRLALVYLLTNAIQATEAFGGKTVRTTVKEEGESLVVEVVDEGPGLDMPDQRADYDLFRTLRDGGTGLGIYGARYIVHQSGGSLSHHRAVDSPGTVVRIEFSPKRRD